MSVEPEVGPPSRRASRRDAVRNDRLVIESARNVFSERGLQASVEDVAARAGVGVGTIYRRFASKDALLDAIAEQLAHEMDEAASAALADEDAARGFESFLEFVGQFNTQKRRYAAALIDRVGDHRVSSATMRKVEALTRNAVQAGALAPDVGADDVKALIVALRTVVSGAPEDSDSWRRFLRIHLAGLRTRR